MIESECACIEFARKLKIAMDAQIPHAYGFRQSSTVCYEICEHYQCVTFRAYVDIAYTWLAIPLCFLGEEDASKESISMAMDINRQLSRAIDEVGILK
jgi:hypothetical protein